MNEEHFTQTPAGQVNNEPRKKHTVLWLILSFVVLVLGYFGIMVVRSLQSLETKDPIEALIESYAGDVSGEAGDASNTGSFDLVTDDDPFFGKSDAPIKIVEFGDFQCPYCKQALESVKRAQAEFGDQIFFQFRDFPVVETHAQAYNAALAAECVQEQGDEKFWQYHDRLYQFQDSLSEEVLLSIAERIGVNEVQISSCLGSEKYADEVQEDYNDGLAAGVRGTPTFFINGRKVPGALPPDIFIKVIQKIQETS